MASQNEITVTIVNEETHVSNVSSNTKIRTAQGKMIEKDESSTYASNVYKHVFSTGDTLVDIQKVEKSAVYKVKKGQSPKLKFEIDESTYEKLPATLQALYKKKVFKVEEEILIEGPISVFNINDYTLEVPELFVYGKNDVIKNLHTFNFKGDNKRAMVNGNTISTYRDGYIEVTFFTEDYTGGMRKVYDTKRDGRHYADGRGRMHPDYPKTLDTMTIPSSKIPEFSAHSKDELNQKMQNYFDHITMTHMLKD